MYQKILVPVDGSPTSDKGLDEAIALAKLTGGQLRLMHVVDELTFVSGFEAPVTYYSEVVPLIKQAGEKTLAKARERAAAQGVTVDTALCEGLSARVSDFVTEQVQAWGADLIVLGTHGRRGLGRWVMGSDAEQIVRTATVPVLLVRAEIETG